MASVSAKVLTDRLVLNARANPGERLELWDARSPGLCLRVSETGRKTWVVRYRALDGRQPRMTLGPAGSNAGDLSVEEARDKASEIRRRAREGADPALEKRREAFEARNAAISSVDDLAEAYLTACETGAYRARRKRKKPATLEAERRLYNGRVKPAFGKFGMRDLKRSDIRPVLNDIAKDAPYQSNRVRAMLRAMYNYAIHEDLMDRNPVQGVLAVADETPRERVLSDHEIRILWRALEDPSGKLVREGGKDRPLWVGRDVRIALQLALLTLQRRGEIAGMLRSELRLDEAVWVIGKDRAKNGKSHVVPLSPAAMRLIREALALQPAGEETEAVFPTRWTKLRRDPIDGAALTHALVDIYGAIGITNANLHDLRRTGASAMASERLKVQPVVISRILNHQMDAGGGSMITFRHYAIYDYAQEKREALLKWSQLVSTIVQGGAPVRARPSPSDAPKRKPPLRAHIGRSIRSSSPIVRKRTRG